MMDMRAEVRQWLQQAAEKALKALHIDRLRLMPPASHDLLLLAGALHAPESMRTSLRRLIPDFIRSRYSDASGAVPADLYDRVIANERLKIAEEVLAWTRPQIKT